MKRKKIRRWLFIEPFEYVALREYLNQMATKGWKLVSVFGNSSCWLTFEKIEETETYHYLVDYTKDFSALTPERETEKAKRYRGFIEEFGYEYIGSNGALQIYRTHHENKVLRENTAEDRSILVKSTLKSIIPYLLLFLTFIINVMLSVRSLKNSLYTSNISVFGIACMAGFCMLLLITKFIPCAYWFWKKTDFQSKNWIIFTSVLNRIYTVCILIGLLSCMLSLALLSYLGLIVIFTVSLYFLLRYSHKAKRKYLVYISMAVLCLCFFNISLRLSFHSILNNDVNESDKSVVIKNIFNEKKGIEQNITTYERNSFLSQYLSIGITFSDDDYFYIDRYKIQDGLFADWIKSQYEKEEYKKLMCPGIREGTKQNGRWVYEGTTSILIVDGYTYLVVDKEFVLDNEGWNKINQFIEL